MTKKYDVLILGGGPAGVTAGIYLSKFGVSCAIIEKDRIGGQLNQTTEILNYPGFDFVTGEELSAKMKKQLEACQVPVIFDEVVDTSLCGEIKKVVTNNETLEAKSVIIASGTSVRTLNIENEKQFLGKGVYYSATAEKNKVLNENVAVIGGGNSALEDALLLAEKANKVFLVHRRTTFRADQSLVERVNKKQNIQILTPYVPKYFVAFQHIEGLNVENTESKEQKTIDVSKVFILVGRDASNDFVDPSIVRTQQGYIAGDDKMQTNVEGVFVAGDARNTYLRQIVCATSDGAMSALACLNFLRKQK